MKKMKLFISLISAAVIAASTVLSAAAAHYKGDIDRNDNVTISDVVTIQKHLSGKSSIAKDKLIYADMNDDNKINVFDLVLAKRVVLGDAPKEEVPSLTTPAVTTTVTTTTTKATTTTTTAAATTTTKATTAATTATTKATTAATTVTTEKATTAATTTTTEKATTAATTTTTEKATTAATTTTTTTTSSEVLTTIVTGSNEVIVTRDMDWTDETEGDESKKVYNLTLGDILPEGAIPQKFIVKLSADSDMGQLSFGAGMSLAEDTWQVLTGVQNGTGTTATIEFDVSEYEDKHTELTLKYGVFQFGYYAGTLNTITLDSITCEYTIGIPVDETEATTTTSVSEEPEESEATTTTTVSEEPEESESAATTTTVADGTTQTGVAGTDVNRGALIIYGDNSLSIDRDYYADLTDATGISVPEITGNGTYTARFELSESNVITWLELRLLGANETYLSTLTYPNLNITIEGFKVDGVETTKALDTVSANLSNWEGASISLMNLLESTTVNESIEVTFTITGLE